jgi:hypothetical protein
MLLNPTDLFPGVTRFSATRNGLAPHDHVRCHDETAPRPCADDALHGGRHGGRHVYRRPYRPVADTRHAFPYRRHDPCAIPRVAGSPQGVSQRQASPLHA